LAAPVAGYEIALPALWRRQTFSVFPKTGGTLFQLWTKLGGCPRGFGPGLGGHDAVGSPDVRTLAFRFLGA